MMEEKKNRKGETFYKSVATGTMEMNVAEVEEMDKGWGWAVVGGILMTILGAVAIVYPAITSVSVVYLLGAVLAVGAVVQFVHAFSVRNWKGFFWHLLIAAVYAIAGVMLLVYPLGGLVTLTLVLALYFFISGILKVILSISARHSTTGWGWMLFSGILALVLGVLIWANWPVGSLWFIGLLVGIDLIVGGFSLAAMGISVHSMAKEELQ